MIKTRSFLWVVTKEFAFSQTTVGIWTWRLVKLKLTSSNLQTFGTQVNMSVIRVKPVLGSLCHITWTAVWKQFHFSYSSRTLRSLFPALPPFCDWKPTVHILSLYVGLICCQIGGGCDELGWWKSEEGGSWDRGITLSFWMLSFIMLKNSYHCNTRALLREAYNNIIYSLSCPVVCRSCVLAFIT